jgi:hypothetical protein
VKDEKRRRKKKRPSPEYNAHRKRNQKVLDQKTPSAISVHTSTPNSRIPHKYVCNTYVLDVEHK